jgi:hypothetical protein
LASHRGVGRLLRCLDEAARAVRGIGILLEWNRFALVSDVDLQSARPRGDRKTLVTELPDDVERFARGLLQCEPQLVRLHRTLDLGAHVCGGLEEAVRRDQPVERLMRSLEVVVADEVVEPSLRVDHVGKHGATEKLVPQRLPETLDLAERLRMLRTTADVLHAQPTEQLLEFGLAAPHCVLPTVVGQHLGRVSVRRDAALEGLHHER